MVYVVRTMFTCTKCLTAFTRKDNLVRHLRTSCPFRLCQTTDTSSGLVTTCTVRGTGEDQPSTSNTSGKGLCHSSLLSKK